MFFFFCCLGGGPGPAQTAKKTHPPKQQKKTCPRPFRACLFFLGCLGGWVCVFFLLFGRGRVFFFCCLGGGPRPRPNSKKNAPAQTAKKNMPPPLPSVFVFFGLFGRVGVCVFFAVWAGTCFFFLLFGRGPRPRPNSKKNAPAQTAKKNMPPPLPSVFVFFGLFGRVGVCVFFAVWAGTCFFFLLFGRGPRPRPNSKKNAPAQTAKKNMPPPLPSVFVFFGLFGRVGVCVFFAVWAGCVFFFFCCLGGGRVLFIAVWAGACSFFAVWAGACFFLAVWAGGVFFFAVWAGDGSSLTYPSAWLVFKRPNNKRDRTAKKKTRVPLKNDTFTFF